ncbi:hypothetical protein D584_03568 [Brucella intermedia M86]|uniref:Uncharacterized protein n=1 Tax=Brucella intermedia M86 TaxID=1234597 RepID=M5JRW1_9HYPH|nr:hypothetical protein D584_03568 [Brucella intermedia M86]
MERICFDRVHDGPLAPSRKNPDHDPHQDAAGERCNIGARLQRCSRTEFFAGLKREDRLVHPLRNTAYGGNHQP